MGIAGTTFDALDVLSARGQVQPVDWPDGRQLSGADFMGLGRLYTPSEVLEGSDFCVLGHRTAQDLFQGDGPIDQVLWVNRDRCTVIGVVTELETIDATQRFRSRPNEALYIPISTAIRNLFDEEPSVTITARAIDEGRMDETKAQLTAYLRGRHGIEQDFEGNYEDDFDLTTRRDILGAQQESARTFSLLLAAMAVVSLVVGGIGIMNVMLVAVTERTREIGVRMAVGARAADVVGQFLLEAVLISAVGGAVGIGAGILAIPLAARLNDGIALLDPGSIPLAFVVAVLTGVIFGLYPAVRASRLDPIEALRRE